MTYPPQQPGPHGQQGQPYGQQWAQQGQQPYGQQQWGQPYGQQPYGQPYPGQPGQFQPGGFGGPPPPKKNKTALWASLSAGAVVLVALLITGFVAPGFFLGDDSDGPTAATHGGTDKTGTRAKSASTPKQLARALVSAVNKHDKPALQGLTCSNAKPAVSEAMRQLNYVDRAELRNLKKLEPKRGTERYVALFRLTVRGTTDRAGALLEKQRGSWCWRDYAGPSGSAGGIGSSTSEPSYPGSSTRSPVGSSGDEKLVDVKRVADDLLSAINDGKKSEAMAFACEDSRTELEPAMDKAIAARADFKWDPDIAGGSYFASVPLYSGGKRVGSLEIERESDSDRHCVTGLRLSR